MKTLLRSRIFRRIYIIFVALLIIITTLMNGLFLYVLHRRACFAQFTLKDTLDITILITSVNIFGVGIFLIASLLVARKLTDPIREITKVADAFRLGDYSKRVRHLKSDELG